MQIKIKRIDPSLPLPEYQTNGAVAFDLYARERTTIGPGAITLIPLNVIVAVPEGYFLILAARSSTAIKKHIMMANNIGIIDQDFCGPDDEIKFAAYNFTATQVTIERGDRIAQAMLIKLTQATIQEITKTEQQSRGGFGSTGE